ncbi:MAG: hypothetical protein H3C27_14635 [Opitutaceae bacterium]|nr:hypothetical protein [Opitutaceae bacterium]
MKPLARLFPLFLLAGLIVSGSLYFRASSHRAKLETRLQAVTAEAQRTELALTDALAREDGLRQQLAGLDEALGATKVRLTASENRNIELTRESARLRLDLNSRDTKLAEQENELRSANASLARLQSLHLSPEERSRFEQTIGRLEFELTETKRELLGIRAQTVSPPPALQAFTTSRGRTASVVSIGPANAFVVVNYGSSHGALPSQTMQIRRGPDTLATVRISDVHPQHSVAQVLPDSVQGALHKGDLAVLSPSTTP